MKIFLLIVSVCLAFANINSKRIAIIGCGAGGSSAAHFLKDY